MAKKNKYDSFDFLNTNVADGLIGPKKKEITEQDISNKVINIDTNKLKSYHNHTYKVLDNDEMQDLVDSIRENGVITPLTVRKYDDDYEIIAGHRRKFAADRAGLTELPCIVVDIDDDAADIMMVDSNYQREHILPSEKAFSYKVKLDALKRQGKRTDLDDGEKIDSIDIISNDSGDSKSKIQRYIRLTYLDEKLLDMVDKDYLKMSAGVLLSYATKPAQQAALEAMEESGKPIGADLAEKIKALSANKKKVSKEMILEELTGKKPVTPSVRFNENAFKEFVPQKVQKLPPEKRFNYHKRALEMYAEYIRNNPEEWDNL